MTKLSTLKYLGSFAESLAIDTESLVLITDNSKVLAVAGTKRCDLVGKAISAELATRLADGLIAVMRRNNVMPIIIATTELKCSSQMIHAIYDDDGNTIGAIISLTPPNAIAYTTDLAYSAKSLKLASNIIGRMLKEDK
jgi:Stage V sporulation protein T C-terminal, transcription factor